MKVVSLFSGCGGLDLGFKRAGFDIIWANDNFPDACETYKREFGNHILCEDIFKVNLNKIPKADVIIGGPPCQGFSGVGKRDPKDDRSKLVWRYIEIVDSVKPNFFLFENVTGIRSSKTPDGKNVLDELKKQFELLGYNTSVHLVNSADYGVPQRRKRVFIVGSLKGYLIEAPKPTHSEDGIGLKRWVSSYDALSDLGVPTEEGLVKYKSKPKSDFQSYLRENNQTETDLHILPYSSPTDRTIISYIKPGGNYMDVPDHASTKRIMYFKQTGGRTTTYARLDPNMPGYTINTYFNRPNVGCNIHYDQDRMITIREGLRIQSFPDDYSIFSSNKRNYYVQVGNAVPPLLGYAWANQLKKYL
jgi:DNA (cytosine-5)-methyltransferase 1